MRIGIDIDNIISSFDNGLLKEYLKHDKKLRKSGIINENAEYVEEATLTQALRGDFKIIKTYIEQLKELGIYDNTTIIVTADHGYFYGELKQPQTCLFLVKQILH